MSITIKASTLLRVTAGLILLMVVAWRASPAQGQTCLKYTNNLPFCSSTEGQLADEAWCDPLYPDAAPLLSPENETILYSRLYADADSPEEAMDEWGKYGFPLKYADQEMQGKLMWLFTEDPDDGEAINVWFDFNKNMLPDDQGTTLYFQSLTREGCCEIVVKGPHELVPDVWYSQPNGPKTLPVVANQPEDGRKFTTLPLRDMNSAIVARSQVWEIRRPNQLKNERFHFVSDLFRLGADELGAEELRKLETDALGKDFDGALDNTPFDHGTDDPRDDAPQVDHIIPRVDKYGCPCGSNSSKNAHVISAKLNRQMSNNCSDPRRIAIIKHYAVVGAPSAAELQSNEESAALVLSFIEQLVGGAFRLVSEVFGV